MADGGIPSEAIGDPILFSLNQPDAWHVHLLYEQLLGG
jgi:hypothetical protein